MCHAKCNPRARHIREDVFGELRPPSTPANEWRFTGEQRDPQGGRNFYYLRARYYDPGIGRFLSQDPLPAGNLYAYVGNNPVTFVDPSGAIGVPGFDTVVGGTVGATVGGLSTLAADFIDDGKINRGLDEYATNIGKEALVGALCGTFGPTPACFAAVTFAASAGEGLVRQELQGTQFDLCQSLAESLGAAIAAGVVGKFIGGALGGVRGPKPRFPIRRAESYWLGAHAKREYTVGGIGLPFDTLASELPCGGGNSPARGKE